MNDLMLTDSGDLLFLANKRKETKIRLSFLYTDTTGINLSFYLDGCKEKTTSSGISLQFEISDEREITQSAKMIKDLQAYRQACLIRIKTPLEQLPKRLNIGSNLEKVRHDFLFLPATIQSTTNILKEAISDILPNATVTVTPIAKQTENGYRQMMNLKIYDEDLVILNYDLE